MNKIYRKEIDFLRALAVIFVILFHYFPNIMPRGYLGVDLFFVISGFLISHQIYNLKKNNKFSIKNFYLRRIKRIFPATLFVLFFTFLISFFILTDKDFMSFSRSLIYSIFFSSNFFFWIDGGYFGPNDGLKPLLHTWSLSVEEQFYIFFPLVFTLLITFIKSLKNLILVIFLISVISFSFQIFLENVGGHDFAFFLLPTRIWNFGLGVLSMLIFINEKKPHTSFEAILFLILIIFGFFYNKDIFTFNFLIIFSTFLFLRKKMPNNFYLNKLIYNKHITYIGIISFSLYLWHWPIYTFLKYYFVDEVSILLKILCILFVFLISHLTYQFIEKSFRYEFNLKKLFIYIVSIFLILISASVFNLNLKTNKRYETNSPNFIAQFANTNFRCQTIDNFLYNIFRACILNKPADNDYELAIIGNSHAQMYAPSIIPYLKKYSRKALLIPMTGCLPTLNVNINKDCYELSKKQFQVYIEDPKIKTILIASTWKHDILYDGNKYLEDDKHIILANALLALIRQIEKNDKNVFLVGPIQRPLYELPQNLSRMVKFGHIKNNEIDSELKIKREFFEKDYIRAIEILSNEIQKKLIRLDDLQCDYNYCYFGDKKGLYFADGSHISNYGSFFFSRKFNVLFQ